MPGTVTNMLRNDDTFPVMTPDSQAASPPLTPTRQHANNDFDDIFGSAPSSPLLVPARSRDSAVAPESESLVPAARYGNSEPSDVPRLRSAHSTAGYREGLAAAKNTSIQAGFDEGYSLGSTVGVRVGVVVGVLEGILAALEADTKIDEYAGMVEDRKRIKELVEEGREELKTESVFGPQYWGSDGIWIYKVPGEEEGKEVTFNEVTDAHPLLIKWESIARQEADRWDVCLTGLEAEKNEDSSGPLEERSQRKDEGVKMVTGEKKGIEW